MTRVNRIIIVIAVVFFMLVGYQIFRRDTRSVEPVPVDTTASFPIQMDTPTLERLFRDHPTHAPIALQLGNLYAQKGGHREAVKYYKLYHSLDSSAAGTEILLDIAKEYYALGMPDSARYEIGLLLKTIPDHPGGLYNLGAIAANQGETDEAIRIWSEMVKRLPGKAETAMAERGLEQLRREKGK